VLRIRIDTEPRQYIKTKGRGRGANSRPWTAYTIYAGYSISHSQLADNIGSNASPSPNSLTPSFYPPSIVFLCPSPHNSSATYAHSESTPHPTIAISPWGSVISWPTCHLLADMPTTSTDQPTSRSDFPLSPLHPSRHILVPLTVRQPNPTLSNPLISHHSIRSYAPIRWIRSHAPPMSATNLTSFPSIHSCLSISVHPLPSIIPAH
jgi:hypothetical protein